MAYTHYILVCGGTGCESSNADLIYKNLQTEAKNFGVEDKVQIVKTGCFGFCEKGPIVKVLPEDSFYVEVKPEDAKDIIAEQVVKGREVKRLLYNKEKKSIEDVEEIQFYQKQLRIVLRNCGVINPEDIDEYEVERLASYLERPVRINIASASNLRSCGLFTQFQAASLLDYRERHGDLMSYSELALVDGFTEEKVQLLIPFISLPH